MTDTKITDRIEVHGQHVLELGSVSYDLGAALRDLFQQMQHAQASSVANARADVFASRMSQVNNIVEELRPSISNANADLRAMIHRIAMLAGQGEDLAQIKQSATEAQQLLRGVAESAEWGHTRAAESGQRLHTISARILGDITLPDRMQFKDQLRALQQQSIKAQTLMTNMSNEYHSTQQVMLETVKGIIERAELLPQLDTSLETPSVVEDVDGISR